MTHTRTHTNHTKTLTLTTTLTTTLAAIVMALGACAGGTNKGPTSPKPASPAVAHSPAATPDPTIDRAALRKTLAAKRRVQIQRLRAYADKGAFPKNREQPGMLNVFIDDDGAICAAANLMWHDGKQDLVRKTSVADNYLRLATVTSGPLMDWMLTSGLTQDEVDRIQEPYAFEEPLAPEPVQIAEVERLQAHFATVLIELEANFEVSLDVAIDRLMANPTLVASL